VSARAELRALTGARGLAAWLVVFYHLRLSLPPIPDALNAVIARGYLAVDFFFVLSGFVIALSSRGRIEQHGWAAVPAFLRRRFARVWPLHAVVLTGGAALAVLLWATGRHVPHEFPFAELPLHYLLIQNWGLTPALSWNDPAWSISAEFAAYLAFPALVLIASGRRWPPATLIAGIVVIAAALALANGARGAASLNTDIAHFGVVRCLAGFGIGMLVHALWSSRRGLLPVVGIAGLAALAWASGVADEALAVPLIFAGTVFALADRDPRWLGGGVLHRLGEWSYATYLAHFLMWKAFKLAFVHAPGPVTWPLIALYLGMLLAASALLYRIVELPAQAWINRRSATTGAQKRAPA
jgi:peptidoglycan/LPS O-acetylase OafA/YrhL